MNVKLLIILILCSSCAYIIEKADQDFQNNEKIEISLPQIKTYCQENESLIQILSENESNHSHFKDFLSKAQIKAQLSFIDEIVLWSLIQMNLRPDLSSPYSRIQVSLKYKNIDYYFNYFSSENNEMTYLFGLEDLLKKFKSQNSLLRLAQLIDLYYSENLFVSKDFANFLKIQKNNILKSELHNNFIRGDETLRENERIRKINFSNLIASYANQKQNTKNIKVSNFLFDFNLSETHSANCNYDMGLYKNSVFLISKNKISSNIFGLKNGSNSFIASSTQNLSNFGITNNKFFFKGEDNTRPAAFCTIKDSKLKKTLWLYSSEQRDPGQHLYHMFEYGLQSTKSISAVDQFIKFSRYLFLQSPTRLMFESNRSSNEQLSELLKLNIPIYHADSLGKVISFSQSDNYSSFVIDDRQNGGLSCLKR